MIYSGLRYVFSKQTKLFNFQVLHKPHKSYISAPPSSGSQKLELNLNIPSLCLHKLRTFVHISCSGYFKTKIQK